MKPIHLDASEIKKAGGDVGAAMSAHVNKLREQGLDGASEKEVVSEVVTALRLQGYCTPREWKPGARGIFIRVGQRMAKGSGTDEGAPDLIVVELRNCGARITLIEIKARTKEARESKEQTTLIALGIVHRVNSAAQVLALLE